MARFTFASRSFQGSHGPCPFFTRLSGPLHIFSRLSWPVSILFKALMARITDFFFFRRFTAPAHLHDSTPSHTGKPTRATQCILRILFKLLIIKPPTAAVSGCHRQPLPEVRHVASQRFRCGWVGFEIAAAKYQARPSWGDRPLKKKAETGTTKTQARQAPFFLINPKINFVYTKTVAPR
jgi:hypothetical protein